MHLHHLPHTKYMRLRTRANTQSSFIKDGFKISNPYWWHTWERSHSHFTLCDQMSRPLHSFYICSYSDRSVSCVHLIQQWPVCFFLSSSQDSEKICEPRWQWEQGGPDACPHNTPKTHLIALSCHNLDLHFTGRHLCNNCGYNVRFARPPFCISS